MTAKQAHSPTVFGPDEYLLNLMCSLPPASLRILMIMGARINPATGKAEVTNKELRDLLGGIPANISRSKTRLLSANLIAKADRLNTYFVNPKVFRPISVML
ncbi:hypothetical protein [Spirosoma soli]|uniref:hypothetical protein n=1 Tax=Spirosoma soli TaxID=1770529 RepID=UPI0036D317B1